MSEKNMKPTPKLLWTVDLTTGLHPGAETIYKRCGVTTSLCVAADTIEEVLAIIREIALDGVVTKVSWHSGNVVNGRFADN